MKMFRLHDYDLAFSTNPVKGCDSTVVSKIELFLHEMNTEARWHCINISTSHDNAGLMARHVAQACRWAVCRGTDPPMPMSLQTSRAVLDSHRRRKCAPRHDLILRLPFFTFCVFSILPERRVCGCFIKAEKKQSTDNLTFNLRCPGSVR